MTLLHRPTVLRVVLLSAGSTLVAVTVAAILAPTLVDLVGASTARALTLVGGFAVRLLAGRLATRHTWAAGGDLRLVLACVVTGGVLGWVVFPGWVALVGVVSVGEVAARGPGLLVDLALFVVALALGAVSAKWGRRTY